MPRLINEAGCLTETLRVLRAEAWAGRDSRAIGLASEALGRARALHTALLSLQSRPVAAPPADTSAANREPHDEVEEASMESFPASDPPSTRRHER